MRDTVAVVMAFASLFLTVGKMYVAAFVTFVCLYYGYKYYKKWSGNEEQQNEPKKKERKNKGKPAPGCKDKVPDIEDFGKSLIPKTMKQMKADGLTPYTVEERKELIAELNGLAFPNFKSKVLKSGQKLIRESCRVLQANIGLYCNQACTHCHVDSSPSRKEMMSRETTDRCLEVIRNSPSIKIIDLTGGAPELNKEFRYWVTECRKLGLHIVDRCNLTVLLEPKQRDLCEFLAENEVHIIASLPCYVEDNVDGQRGDEVFVRSIAALRMLNERGYGVEGSSLKLDLVYNPTGIHLPPKQEGLQTTYKEHLKEKYDISFNKLICVANVPINRFHDHLKNEDKLQVYMDILVENFNADTVKDLMCKDYISVKWDGQIYDCDFNQQVEMPPRSDKPDLTVYDIDCTDDLLHVPIATSLHCYACTAGQGSG